MIEQFITSQSNEPFKGNLAPYSPNKPFSSGELLFQSPLKEKITSPGKIIGFNSKAEVEASVKNFNNLIIGGKTKEEAIHLSFAEIDENLRSWDEEFNCMKNIFSANYQFGEFKGKKRIVDRTCLPVARKINKEERQGQALESWVKAEEFLVNAPEGSLVVVASPKGDSGQVIKGKRFSYVDSYFQLAAKVNGQVVFFTIRTYSSVENCRKILEQLISENVTETKPPTIGKTSYDEVSNIVATPLTLSSVDNPILNKGLESFVGSLLERLSFLKSDIFGEGKTKDQVYQEFLDRHKRLKFDQRKLPLINELKAFYLANIENINNPQTHAEFVKRIDNTLLKLTLLERNQISSHNAVLSLEDKEKAYDHMKKMHGCSDSGNKEEVELIEGLGGRRIGVTEEWHSGVCSKCGAGKEGAKAEISCNLCRSCIRLSKQIAKMGIKNYLN